MSRLTKRYSDNSGYTVEDIGPIYNEVQLDGYLDAVEKLGETEDFEEELKISFKVLREIKKNGFYHYVLGFIEPNRIFDIDLVNEDICFEYINRFGNLDNEGNVEFKEYGTKFWLKEEQQPSESKKYLTWKDIEFGDKAYDIKVKLGDNIYALGIGLGYINHVAVLHAVDEKTYFKDIHFTEQDEQFFNDLKLEVVVNNYER